MRNFWEFVVAAGVLGGGSVILAIVLFVIAAIEHFRDRNVAAAWLFIIACLAFCFGAFSAWNQERESVERSTTEISHLNEQIASLVESHIAADIEFAVLGAQPKGSHAGLIVSLRNSGAESAVIPDSWQLSAVTSNGMTYRGWANTLKDKNLDFCLGPHKLMRLVKSDALYLKASERPIARNGYAQGFLWFAFPDLDRELLVTSDTKLVLMAKSVSGQTIETTIDIGELIRRSSEPTKFFAGIQNPIPLDQPCSPNQPY